MDPRASTNHVDVITDVLKRVRKRKHVVEVEKNIVRKEKVLMAQAAPTTERNAGVP